MSVHLASQHIHLYLFKISTKQIATKVPSIADEGFSPHYELEICISFNEIWGEIVRKTFCHLKDMIAIISVHFTVEC